MVTPRASAPAVAEWDPDPSNPTIRINPSYLGISNGHKKGTALHEFGHQLGFDDVYGSTCGRLSVMGPFQPDAATELTEDDWCGIRTAYDPICEAGGGEDYYNYCTPLVLSFGQGQLQFSRPWVGFDIAGNGDLPTVAWTIRRTDGFLALDRNGDGMIGSGRELFGNSTPLSDTVSGQAAFSGFNALEYFDRVLNGGNGNGLLDAGDLVFARLVVWFDDDRDGVSQTSELHSVASLGIQAIQLRGYALNEVDSHGNVLWFGNSFVYKVGEELRTGRMTDVILKVK